MATIAQLQAFFASYNRDFNQLCQALVWQACNRFGSAPVTYGSAISAYRASAIASRDSGSAPAGAIHYWDIGSDGHVAISLGGDYCLMGSSKIDTAWGINAGVTTVSRYTSRTGARYLGWSYKNGQNSISISDSYGSTAGGGSTPIANFSADTQAKLQQYVKNIGLYSGPVDGALGTNSWIAIQQWLGKVGLYGGPADGAPGENTYKALQTVAQQGGYTGPVDGAFGPIGEAALNKWLTSQVSGGSAGGAPSGTDWAAWQTFLAAYGYTGPADGAPGTNTYIALQKFLASYGYTGPADGEPGPKTWEAFARAVAAGYPKPSTPTTPDTPASGQPAGIDWKAWQTFLAAYGYTGPADGEPGVNTYTALQKFLGEKFGYAGAADGVPGDKTWEAMVAALAAGYPAAGGTPTTPPTDTKVKAFGIDVATSQRDINFVQAKKEGVEFVIVKMGGLNVTPQYVAPNYKKQIDGVIAAGINKGHYYLVGGGETPEQQAEYFVKNLYQFDLRHDVLALDNEKLDSNGTFWGDDDAYRFLAKVIQLTGIEPNRVWLYGGAADFRGHKPWTQCIALGVRFWWAAYGNYPTGHVPDHEPSLQGSIPEAAVHQYSSKVAVAGYALDGNASTKYTTAELFATGVVAPPVDPPVETPEEPTNDETLDAFIGELEALIEKYRP